MQIKTGDADRFLARPEPAVRVILVYGNDEGLVSERVAAFVKTVTGESDDPFSHVRLEPAQLSEDPRLLADEAHAVPLFGGRRAISVRISGNWSILPALEPILAAPPVDSWIVIGGGDLKKTSPLRRLCESHPAAAAVACYADSDRDLDRIIDEETRNAGLRIAADARAALKELIGGDRLASRSEVKKLCLYADGRSEITIDDVRAIIGDASAFAQDEAIDAVALGDPSRFDIAYRRLTAAGTPGVVIAGAAIRHFNFLHRARAALDDGTNLDAIVRSARPPLFFDRQKSVARQIANWPLPRSERALAALDQAMLDSRLRSAISDEVIGQALLAITAMAAAAVQRQR